MTEFPQHHAERESERAMARYVMSGSTGMIGACATLIGLVKLHESQGQLTGVDEAVSITAVAFLVSAFLAYLALRTRNRQRLQARLEAVADIVFLAAMLAIVAIGVTFAFDLI